MRFGVQLHSLKARIAELGVDKVLSELSEIGVSVAELAGFYDLSPKELSALFKEYNIEPYAAHIGLAAIEGAIPYIKELGIKKVFIPICRFAELSDPEGYKNFIKGARKAKEDLSALGIPLGYHNHYNELKGEEDLLDKISLDAGIDIELDLFWARAARKNALELMDKYGSRLSALHIREMDKRADPDAPTDYPHAVVGEGASMCRECIEKAISMGIEDFILEVSDYPIPEMEYIEKSIASMKTFAKIAEDKI